MPFKTTEWIVKTTDGRNVTLVESVTYVAKDGETIVIPAGAASDGASTPCALWLGVPPFGTYWPAAFLHDYLYRCTSTPKERCDALFLEAMESLGVSEFERELIYEGVRVGGASAFRKDRTEAAVHS